MEWNREMEAENEMEKSPSHFLFVRRRDIYLEFLSFESNVKKDRLLMDSPPRQPLAPEEWGSPPSGAKDVDTPLNSPPSREKAIESLSPSGMVQCAEMLGIGAGYQVRRRMYGMTQNKLNTIQSLISRVLSFTFDDRGSCPVNLAPHGYNGPLYAVELCSPSRVVFLTGWKAQVEHAYRSQQANMLWNHAFTEDGALKDSCRIPDMKKAVGTIMSKLITDEDIYQWLHLIERPILMPEYTEEIDKIRMTMLPSMPYENSAASCENFDAESDEITLKDLLELT